MITSKLGPKGQTTVPQRVRVALGLRKGDEIAYEIGNGRAVIACAASSAGEDPFQTFSEWGSDADRKVYAGL